jgi:K+-transporting ATPase KdpF subunit
VRRGALAMNAALVIAALLTALLFAYLCAALLKPEWFE